MAQQQTNNANTNNDFQTTPVSFNDVSLETLEKSFSDTYKVSKGSSSQVVLGFKSMSSRLHDPQNEYQQEIYPQLKNMCNNLYTKYNETFLSNFSSDVERQVFGANLNGNRNTGSLYRSIPSGVNRNLTYNYSQFGQLLRVLSGRLKFIVNRDAGSVQRYINSNDETNAYHKLQEKSTEFLTYLETVSNEWDTFIKTTRTKFSVEETPREQRQPRQPRQTRQPSEQRQPRQTRQLRQTRQPSEQRPQTRRTTRPTQTTQTENKLKTQYKTIRKSESPDEGEWKTVVTKKSYNKSN